MKPSSIRNNKFYCYKCGNETNQNVKFETTNLDTRQIFSVGDNFNTGWIIEKTDWLFSECKGCESNNLLIKTYHIGPNEVEREVKRKSLPGKSKRNIENWIFRLNQEYVELLAEIYSAFNSGNFRLAMMGARAIVDMHITDTIGDKGTFRKKLELLVENKHINNSQFELLETSIEAGNASAHRGYKPSEEILSSVIDIIEHLLKPMALRTEITNLRNEIPKREKT